MRRVSLAVDRMTREQLWTTLWRRYRSLERDVQLKQNGGNRERDVMELGELLRELYIRGDQLTLD